MVIPRVLRERAAAAAQVARMNEIDRVVAFHLGEGVAVVDVTERHEIAPPAPIGFQM